MVKDVDYRRSEAKVIFGFKTLKLIWNWLGLNCLLSLLPNVIDHGLAIPYDATIESIKSGLQNGFRS